MKRMTNVMARVFAMAIAFSWTVLPNVARAQNSVSGQTATAPIAPLQVNLSATGALHGTVMAPGGKPAAGQTVVLGKQGKVVSRTKTNAEGGFLFEKIAAGEYQLATNDSVALVQCHDANEQVADAVPSVLMGREAMLARGHLKETLFHPLFVGLVIAAAIAIPIAIAANDEDAS